MPLKWLTNKMARATIWITAAVAIAGCSGSQGAKSQVPLAPKEPDADPPSHDRRLNTFPREPLVVLIESNPWLMVRGSDSPVFALYSDGLVIYRSEESVTIQNRFVLLNKPELNQLLDSFSPLDRFWKLESHYDATSWTDQPTTTMHLWHEARHKGVSVYGNLRKPEQVIMIPRVFVSIYARLIGYRQDRSLPWLPEKVEVLLWPTSAAEGVPIEWPNDWPGLDDEDTRQREEGQYSIFLPSEHVGELGEFVQMLENQHAVLLDGKKWFVSYRFPFPCEDKWMRQQE